MSIDFMEYLRETFEDAENLDMEKIKRLAQETKDFFERLEDILRNGSPQAKSRALMSASEIKKFLEDLTQNLSKEGFSDFEEELSEEEKGSIVEFSEYLGEKPSTTKPIILS